LYDISPGIVNQYEKSQDFSCRLGPLFAKRTVMGYEIHIKAAITACHSPHAP